MTRSSTGTISSCSRRIGALLFAECCAACSTSRKAFTDCDPIPEGAGQLSVCRPVSGFAALVGSSLALKGELVARLSSDGYGALVQARGENLVTDDIGSALSEFRDGSSRVL